MGKSYEEHLRKERDARIGAIREAIPRITALMGKYGVDELRIGYTGYGDEGCFHEIYSGERTMDAFRDLREEIENTCFLLMNQNYEGWEIENGSQGEIVFSVKDGRLHVSIMHEWREYVREPEIDALKDVYSDGAKDASSSG